ncbi:Glucanosyltransferase-domain-containing protein [Geopyxis carbonaria]|nr:Glucanosyltransferase-domain-containing protein [Geopyxis carbonaria]
MRGFTTFSTLAVLAGMAAALEPITVKGNAFFQGDKRWYIRGVDYQPGGPSNLQDPLANPDRCKRDIVLFKELGLNAIRIYTVDNSKNHDECMKELEDAGIYLILDLNTPDRSINRADPESTYNVVYHQHIFATVDAFSKYDNTAMFFAANEVVNDEKTTSAATYVKAVIRDLKQYIKKQSPRTIPVGYSAADVSQNRQQMAEYLNCGTDEEARGDFFAFNDYSWCGDSSFKTAGWDQKVENFKDYSVPLYFSEYGCNQLGEEIVTRTFQEVESLYSTDMTVVFSGGLVYEYSQEDNKFGLVEISKDNKSVKKRDDFNNLMKQFKAVDNPSGDGDYQSDLKPSSCPSFVKGKWEANNTLPTIDAASKKLIANGAGKPLGNANTGSASTGSSSTDSSETASASGAASTGDDSQGAASSSSVQGVFLATAAIVGGMMLML